MSIATEDLNDLPLHAEIRDVLLAMVARGVDPLEVADAAQIVGAGLAVGIEGPARTGAKLYASSLALLRAADPHSDRALNEIN